MSYVQSTDLGPHYNMLQRRIVAIKPTKVTLTYTIDNTTETINVAAGQVYTRMFNAQEAAKIYSNATGKSNKSLHIVSDELICLLPTMVRPIVI